MSDLDDAPLTREIVAAAINQLRAAHGDAWLKNVWVSLGGGVLRLLINNPDMDVEPPRKSLIHEAAIALTGRGLAEIRSTIAGIVSQDELGKSSASASKQREDQAFTDAKLKALFLQYYQRAVVKVALAALTVTLHRDLAEFAEQAFVDFLLEAANAQLVWTLATKPNVNAPLVVTGWVMRILGLAFLVLAESDVHA
jgi:hypothetical protein